MTEDIPDGLLEQVAKRFRILGEATRLAILHCLLRAGERNVGQIVADTGRSQANVSKHLKQLHAAGLLSRRKDGLQVFYRIDDPLVERLYRLIRESLSPGRSGRSKPRRGSDAP